LIREKEKLGGAKAFRREFDQSLTSVFGPDSIFTPPLITVETEPFLRFFELPEPTQTKLSIQLLGVFGFCGFGVRESTPAPRPQR
jgi:hypothetical protein